MRTGVLIVLTIVSASLCPSFSQSSLDDILSPGRLPYLKESRLIQISSNDTSGGNNDFIVIPAGNTAVLADIRGPGVITTFWVTISSADRYFLRRILLRMYWDGERSPSVEVPIGDFFGTGFEYRHYVTPFIGMSSGGYYSYFPMPFGSGARVEVVNETGQDIGAFYYHIDYQKLRRPPGPAVARFHASWHRDIRAPRGRYFTLLEAEGRGHLVGVNLSMQSYDGGLSFLEGDEMIWVDGERTPSIRGTGTEDYFNSGWYFNHGEFAAPYHGLILKDDSLGRIAAYRFHVLDAIPFRKSIRALIEHGDRNTEVADYACTAYWYQVEPHRPFPPMLKASLRIPLRVEVPVGALEAESLLPEGKCAHSVEEMSACGPDWSGMAQLRVEEHQPGDEFTLRIPPTDERCDVDVYYTKGPDYGDVDVVAGGRKVGSLSGYESSVVPGGKIPLGEILMPGGALALTFRSVGKDTRSAGYAVGLDAFVLTPRREFIPGWNIIGPFANPRDSARGTIGLDSVYAPERDTSLAAAYTGIGGIPVSWRKLRTPASGFVDLTLFEPNLHVVAYALAFVRSPVDQTLPLLLGSDDGAKVFLNGSGVFRLLAIRPAVPDEDMIPLVLHRGWNRLLLKIENNVGGYGFYARIRDPGRTLRYATAPQGE
ncbi:MAG TPA: glycoside hydrolase family 172 protein [Bacteroidota bacterium]|nr:glycoside hydrolase family 172 protein [Bacteroidota bacterium]